MTPRQFHLPTKAATVQGQRSSRHTCERRVYFVLVQEESTQVGRWREAQDGHVRVPARKLALES